MGSWAARWVSGSLIIYCDAQVRFGLCGSTLLVLKFVPIKRDMFDLEASLLKASRLER